MQEIMNSTDIAFPHLGIYLKDIPQGFYIGNFFIAYYGVIIGLGIMAGILMAGATASTTAGATIASQTFASTLIEQQVPALAAAAMIHAGATVIDSLPHGSFFHATGGSVNMSIGDRMKLIPFEAMVGLTSTITSVVLFLLFQ